MHATLHSPSFWRTLLVLGRVSNLPTVWSNCLAGWYLGGAGEWERAAWICVGGTLLYTGGMFLNDAFDNRFDAKHRPERPIPSGKISVGTVWSLGFGLLALGTVLLLCLGAVPGVIAMFLAGCIVLYDWVHKKTAAAPVLMASCRFLLYLVAASVGARGIEAPVLWSGLALGLYVIGLSYLAGRESAGARISYWALLLLITPVIIAGMLYGFANAKVSLASVVFLGWLAWCLYPLMKARAGDASAAPAAAGPPVLHPAMIGRAVAGLLAGIVLVDLLLVPASGTILLLFPLFFASALILQRTIPAT